MKAVYWVLPFIKYLCKNQMIIHNNNETNTTIKNVSMFNILDPTVQQYMLEI
jgi:hypothetical protein